jgi:hypothetical protein
MNDVLFEVIVERIVKKINFFIHKNKIDVRDLYKVICGA